MVIIDHIPATFLDRTPKMICRGVIRSVGQWYDYSERGNPTGKTTAALPNLKVPHADAKRFYGYIGNHSIF